MKTLIRTAITIILAVVAFYACTVTTYAQPVVTYEESSKPAIRVGVRADQSYADTEAIREYGKAQEDVVSAFLFGMSVFIGGIFVFLYGLRKDNYGLSAIAFAGMIMYFMLLTSYMDGVRTRAETHAGMAQHMTDEYEAFIEEREK